MKHNVFRLILAVVVAAVAAATAAAVVPATASADYPPYPPELTLKSELRLKANLIRDNLSGSPELVFFGGSRSQRFDPAFARDRIGLRAVNISVSCARPEIAWGFLSWVYHRWPDAKIRWVWGMQAGMLRDRNLDPALLQDSRFYPYFPDDLLAQQRALLPATADQMPRYYGFTRNRYSDLGLLQWNTYDQRRADGYTLQESLDHYIAKMLHEPLGTTTANRARTYFEKTVQLLNEHGTTPVIVLMPIHPRVLRVMREHDMGGERQRMREYLATYGETATIKVLDFTTIKSFNGRAAWFYDGVHITRRNSNRVIVALKYKAADCLK